MENNHPYMANSLRKTIVKRSNSRYNKLKTYTNTLK